MVWKCELGNPFPSQVALGRSFYHGIRMKLGHPLCLCQSAAQSGKADGGGVVCVLGGVRSQDGGRQEGSFEYRPGQWRPG